MSGASVVQKQERVPKGFLLEHNVMFFHKSIRNSSQPKRGFKAEVESLFSQFCKILKKVIFRKIARSIVLAQFLYLEAKFIP